MDQVKTSVGKNDTVSSLFMLFYNRCQIVETERMASLSS
jgi:hypothetical protein